MADGRRVENGVAYGRGYYREAGLADAGGIFFAHHDVDFDFRNFLHAGHLVIVEVGLHDPAAIDGDGIFGHGGEGVDGGAFYLGYDPGGIDRAAAIDGVYDAMDISARGGARFVSWGASGVAQVDVGEVEGRFGGEAYCLS